MSKKISRRDALKTIGFGGLLFPSLLDYGIRMPSNSVKLTQNYENPQNSKFSEPLTCIIIGGGNRGWVYSSFAAQRPELMKVIGVAEPVNIRRDKFKAHHNISEDKLFTTWEEVFERPKFADFVVISTWDRLHYEPAMKAIEMGYHVLLEKAIAQSWEECTDILEQSKKFNRIVGICHVLRYSPYFVKMRELVRNGEIGDVVSMQHLEPIGNVHFSHSFVRGNWRNEQESTPCLLSKSCHDLDIIYWILGEKCMKVSSFGDLKYFRKNYAPAGSTQMCTGGCEVESECPYSAKRIYLTNREWGVGHLIDLQDWEEKKVMRAINEGPYGRCVYRCDNDVVDHQAVNMVFGDDISVSFTMEAHTSYSGRRTRIMGTEGDIVGDSRDLHMVNFKNKESKTYRSEELKSEFSKSGHGGGDYGLVYNFLQAVYQNNKNLLSSTIEDSMESHYIGFKAEESRNNNGVLVTL